MQTPVKPRFSFRPPASLEDRQDDAEGSDKASSRTANRSSLRCADFVVCTRIGTGFSLSFSVPYFLGKMFVPNPLIPLVAATRNLAPPNMLHGRPNYKHAYVGRPARLEADVLLLLFEWAMHLFGLAASHVSLSLCCAFHARGPFHSRFFFRGFDSFLGAVYCILVSTFLHIGDAPALDHPSGSFSLLSPFLPVLWLLCSGLCF